MKKKSRCKKLYIEHNSLWKMYFERYYTHFENSILENLSQNVFHAFQKFYFKNLIFFWKICLRMYFINFIKCVFSRYLKVTLKWDKIVIINIVKCNFKLRGAEINYLSFVLYKSNFFLALKYKMRHSSCISISTINWPLYS